MADAAQCVQRQSKHEGPAKTAPKAKRRRSATNHVTPPDQPREPADAMPAIPAPASDQQIHHPAAAAAAAQPAAQAVAAAPQQAIGQLTPAGQPAPSIPPQQEDPFITAVRILMQQGLPEAKARAALQSVPTAGKSLEGCVGSAQTDSLHQCNYLSAHDPLHMHAWVLALLARYRAVSSTSVPDRRSIRFVRSLKSRELMLT